MQQQLELMDKDSAYHYFLHRLKSAYLLKSYKPENKKRHLIVETEIKGFEKIYIVFHRETFHTFANKFYFNFIQSNQEYRFSEGESLNIEFINKAIEEECVLLFIYPDKKIKWIYPELFRKFAEKHKLINNQERTNIYKTRNYSGNLMAVNEITYSIPVDLLKDFEFDLI